MDKPKMVRVIEYTGTIESYNDLVDHLWDGDSVHIWHLDDGGSMTPKFTGRVVCAKTGVQYKPGDHYSIDIDEDK